MANTEALRELQERLALRLQSAAEPTAVARWLAVEVAGAPLLLSLRQAAEIFTPVPIKPVPYATDWLLGVANLRGGLHTVVDLAAFLGLREQPMRLEGSGARFVALSSELNTNCALVVDKLQGLRSHEQLEPEPDATPEAPRPRFAGPRWRDASGRVWQELDLEALTRYEAFLRIVQ